MDIHVELERQINRLKPDEREETLPYILRDTTTEIANRTSEGGLCFCDAHWCRIYEQVCKTADLLLENLN